jgi:glucan biosynthesis protein C
MDTGVPQIEMRQTTGLGRLDYVDSIRAILLLFGIPFHAAVPYSDHRWYFNSTTSDGLVGYISSLFMLFRMPAFFVIAGFFAAMMLERRGPAIWMRDRARRLLVPLVSAILLIVPIESALLDFRNDRNPFSSFLNLGSLSLPPVGQAWFLRDLFIYCCIAAAVFAVLKVKRRERSFGAPATIAIAMLFVALSAVGTRGFFWTLAALHINESASFAFYRGVFYFPFFVAGALLWLFPKYYQRFITCPAYIPVLGLLFLFALAFHPPTGFVGVREMALGYLAGAVGTWVVLNLAARFLDSQNNLTAFYVNGALTIYLVHVLFTFMFGLMLVDGLGHPLVEWLIIVVLVLASSSAFYWMTRKVPFLHYLFNGQYPSENGARGWRVMSRPGAKPRLAG